MKHRFPKKLGFLVVLALLGTSCTNRPPPRCLPIFILKDAGSLTRYKPGPGKDIIDVLFRGKFIDFKATCDYNGDRTEVEIGLELAFELSRGPANRDRKAAFQYFVAIPQFHPAPQGKSKFSLNVEFPARGTRTRIGDKIELIIPLDPKVRRDKYAIYLGFQLTKDELKDNQRSTKF
jgi:hypothetical protein